MAAELERVTAAAAAAADRDAAVVAAHHAGHSLTAIAAAAGLTRQGIKKIIDRSDMGTLTDYVTGQAIRPATAGEHAQSLAAGETGAYEDADGRAVFVAGGPES